MAECVSVSRVLADGCFGMWGRKAGPFRVSINNGEAGVYGDGGVLR